MNLKNKIKEIYEVITFEDPSEDLRKADIRVKTIISFLCGLISVIMTVMNIIKSNVLMAVSTSVLSICFFLASYIFIRRRPAAASNLMVFAAAVMFSAYAATGENDGFAILWTLLVPLMTMAWIGFLRGFLLSLYFQVFLIIMFYTPMREYVSQHYTDTFMLRYPVLYFAGFTMMSIIVYQKIFFQKQATESAHTDAMTGLGNRLSYNEKVKALTTYGEVTEVNLFIFDVNQLKYVNDNIGHDAGDELIRGAASCIVGSFRDAWVTARVGGDEFYMLLIGHRDCEADRRRFYEAVSSWKGSMAPSLSVSCGFATALVRDIADMSELVKTADKEMYAEKAMYYRKNGIDRRKSAADHAHDSPMSTLS